MGSDEFKRGQDFWDLRNRILDEYPKCPKCGWEPGSGFSSLSLGPFGVARHRDPDKPFFECEALDSPDDYPGPTPAEVVESLKRYGTVRPSPDAVDFGGHNTQSREGIERDLSSDEPGGE